jgi:seryl-tRNA synthetase
MFNKAEIEALNSRIHDLESQNQTQSVRVNELESDNQKLNAFGALSAVELASKIGALQGQLDSLETTLKSTEKDLAKAKLDLVETEDTSILQEVGVYEFKHILADAVAYQDQLKGLQAHIKEFNRADGGAITATTDWLVNGSKVQGRKMVNEVSKLMLRAYNGEVDDAVRTLKPYKIDASVDRLNKVRASIEKLGRSMQVQITAGYHSLRCEELQMTADFLQKQAEEKENQKAERERLREEAQAQKEYQAEKERLAKEHSHYSTLLQQAIETGNEAAAADARQKVEEIAASIAGVDERSANIRAGYVYVISNIGSFGEDVVKIGLTRRLEYEDRIHELSGASVPFIFDIHAVIFSNDAVTLEHELHHKLDDFRINRVNHRKEFFRTTPAIVKDLLEAAAGEHLMLFNETAEAAEWRMSLNPPLATSSPTL